METMLAPQPSPMAPQFSMPVGSTIPQGMMMTQEPQPQFTSTFMPQQMMMQPQMVPGQPMMPVMMQPNLMMPQPSVAAQPMDDDPQVKALFEKLQESHGKATRLEAENFQNQAEHANAQFILNNIEQHANELNMLRNKCEEMEAICKEKQTELKNQAVTKKMTEQLDGQMTMLTKRLGELEMSREKYLSEKDRCQMSIQGIPEQELVVSELRTKLDELKNKALSLEDSCMKYQAERVSVESVQKAHAKLEQDLKDAIADTQRKEQRKFQLEGENARLKALAAAANRTPERAGAFPPASVPRDSMSASAWRPPPSLPSPGAPASGSQPTAVGMLFYQKREDYGLTFVQEIVPNGPAHQNGQIEKHDILRKIDDDETFGKSLEDVFRALQGPDGSWVSLELSRPDSQGRLINFAVSLQRRRPDGFN